MRRGVLTIALAAAACAAPGEDQADVVDLERPRGTFQVVDDRVFVELPAEGGEVQAAGTLLYMNKDGGTYTPGNNDSRTNRSTVLQETRIVPPWDVDAGTWADVMSCVRAQFADYDIEVTDVDPGSAAHIESVVGGSPTDLGLPEGVAGVSPFTPTCGVIANSVVFSFPEALPPSAQIVCEVATQEIAHSFGLDHEFLCEDPMTYLAGCGAKSFRNVAAPCGEFSARSCAVPGKYDCGRDTQNSVALLTERLGLRPGTPPVVSIATPADGAVVPPGFAVTADASDDEGVTGVELRIDGASIATVSAAPYGFTAPADLAEGAHVVEVIARAGTGETSTSIGVEVSADAPPDPPDEPGEGGDGGDSGGDGELDGVGNALVGGCAAGGGAGAGWLVLIVALALGRRRR
ncbi:MAG TPA: Ig-like domain-containing protein [Kofleriaceae bacterium]|nr:Ig-like domain-containing protein [Kofleriaceae bacterium]